MHLAHPASGPFPGVCVPGRGSPPGYREAMTDETASELRTCDWCGRQATVAESLSWSTAVENGRSKTFCDTCSRENLRSMEGKLDSEFW